GDQAAAQAEALGISGVRRDPLGTGVDPFLAERLLHLPPAPAEHHELAVGLPVGAGLDPHNRGLLGRGLVVTLLEIRRLRRLSLLAPAAAGPTYAKSRELDKLSPRQEMGITAAHGSAPGRRAAPPERQGRR